MSLDEQPAGSATPRASDLAEQRDGLPEFSQDDGPTTLGNTSMRPIGKCLLIVPINMLILSIWSPMPFGNSFGAGSKMAAFRVTARLSFGTVTASDIPATDAGSRSPRLTI